MEHIVKYVILESFICEINCIYKENNPAHSYERKIEHLHLKLIQHFTFIWSGFFDLAGNIHEWAI